MPRLKFFQKFLGTFKVFYCSHLRLKIRTIFLIPLISLYIRGVKTCKWKYISKIRKKNFPEIFGDFGYLYNMKLQENINRIKQVMGLITEETIEDLRKILQTKFQSLGFNGNEIKREGENIVYKGFSKTKNGNYVITYNPSDNFYTIDYIDGPNKGFKLKRWTENGESKQEWITDSELHIKLVAKIKEFPCLGSHYYNFRQTNDGKIIVGIDWQDDGGIISFNLDDKTYVVKGGKLDGEQGSFLCNGKEIKWGKVTKSGTTKNVTNRMVDDYFNAVTTSKPIIYGMRDKTSEPENGLIFLLQKKLKELNLYTGEPDGQFGPLTYKAVKEFQKTGKDSEGNPLVSDGKVGPKTIQSLGLMD